MILHEVVELATEIMRDRERRGIERREEAAGGIIHKLCIHHACIVTKHI